MYTKRQRSADTTNDTIPDTATNDTRPNRPYNEIPNIYKLSNGFECAETGQCVACHSHNCETVQTDS